MITGGPSQGPRAHLALLVNDSTGASLTSLFCINLYLAPCDGPIMATSREPGTTQLETQQQEFAIISTLLHVLSDPALFNPPGFKRPPFRHPIATEKIVTTSDDDKHKQLKSLRGLSFALVRNHEIFALVSKVLPSGILGFLSVTGPSWEWPSDSHTLHIAQNSQFGDQELEYGIKSIDPSTCNFPNGIFRHIFDNPDTTLEEHFGTVTGLLGKMTAASSQDRASAAADVLLNYLTAQCSRKVKRRFTRISTDPKQQHWLDILQGVGRSCFSNIDFSSRISASGFIGSKDGAWLELAHMTSREKAWFLTDAEWLGANLSTAARQAELEEAYYQFHLYATHLIGLFGHHLGQVVKSLFPQRKRGRREVLPPKEENFEKFCFHCNALLRISNRVYELAWRSPFWKRLLIFADEGVRATKKGMESIVPTANRSPPSSPSKLVVSKTRSGESPPTSPATDHHKQGVRSISDKSTSSNSSTGSIESPTLKNSALSHNGIDAHDCPDDDGMDAKEVLESNISYDEESEEEEEEEPEADDPMGNPVLARDAVEARELSPSPPPKVNLPSSISLRNPPFSNGEDAQNIILWLRLVTFHIQTVTRWESAAVEAIQSRRQPVIPLQLKVVTTPVVDRNQFTHNPQTWRSYLAKLISSPNSAATIDRYLTSAGRAKIEGPFVGQEHCEATLGGLLWHAQQTPLGQQPLSSGPRGATLSPILKELRHMDPHVNLIGTSKRCCHVCETLLCLIATSATATQPALKLRILDTHGSLYPCLIPPSIPAHARDACVDHYRKQLVYFLNRLGEWDVSEQEKKRKQEESQQQQQEGRAGDGGGGGKPKSLDSKAPSSSTSRKNTSGTSARRRKSAGSATIGVGGREGWTCVAWAASSGVASQALQARSPPPPTLSPTPPPPLPPPLPTATSTATPNGRGIPKFFLCYLHYIGSIQCSGALQLLSGARQTEEWELQLSDRDWRYAMTW
ncbi:hypothetical protein BGX38DRAFT_1263418 [Terfezia claveryi]|nr:hypothetical protein BGX38DRAFT_1263418 [Terfezia claveryi]